MPEPIEGVVPEGEPLVPEPVLYTQDILPEDLRGKDPAEVKMILEQLPNIVRSQKNEIDLLRARTGQPAAVAPVEPPPPAEDFDVLMAKDPRAAMKRFVEEEYGTTLANLEGRVSSNEYSTVAGQLPDFVDYEEDVQRILRETGSPATAANIQGAYTMAVGGKVIQERAQLARLADSTLVATPAPDPALQPANLTETQAGYAAAMGLSPEEFVKYSDDSSFSPTIRTS